MKIFVDVSAKRALFRVILCGLCAGFFNGLIGTGGGILIVFGMKKILEKSGGESRDVFANALAVMLPVSVISAAFYTATGRFPVADFQKYLIPAALGGLAGGILLDKLKGEASKKIFSLIVVWSGVYMIARAFS